MSKTITSPVPKWPGTVQLADPLTFPQYMAWKDGILKARELGDSVSQDDFDRAMLPGLCACVEKWELQGLGQVSPETFPATPRKSSAKLVAWLLNEVTVLIREADDIPNA